MRRGIFLTLVLSLTLAHAAYAAPGHCQVEIINSSGHDVMVHGTFDDGQSLHAFKIFHGDAPHYIDLFYHGYCHHGARIMIDGVRWPLHDRIYDAWTHPGNTIHIRG
jgi:hypothetical protein